MAEDVKNYKILGWVASIISLIGVGFNAYQNIWCWPIWCFGNALWVYYAVKTKQTSQLILWIAYTVVNIWAWWKWLQ
jgi:nicotinamide riboside transporter PnuC